MGMMQSQAKVQMVPDTGVTFDDVVGVDQAKIELEETVFFLKESERFTELGARIPRGLLLEGPPGTGKTLLARAVAGEAGVPFFAASGSEFVEMFVGVGASRVRDLFAQAKKNAPCIIFIDEIDALGGKRGSGMGGGNDEKEQTLNQLLTEMDGFEGNPGIIVIAATNRADVLDDALLRPGRFDRRIMVSLPDFKGRVAILGVHSKGKPLEDDVDLEQIARRSIGFSGASLANLMNEAAIFAARKNKATIGNEQISDALDRVTLGPEKKNAELALQKRELVAFHEAGHAVVGALIPDYDQVAKITIAPRGNAGGLTFFAPSEDRTDSGLYSRQYLESMMAVALGGRIAEEIVFGDDEITTGASNDLERVSSTAKSMVMEYGMSEKIGQVALSAPGRQSPPMSSETMALVDAEVNRLVQGAYALAKQLLVENRNALDMLATALVERETVSAEEFAIMLTESSVSLADYAVLGEVKQLDAEPAMVARRLEDEKVMNAMVPSLSSLAACAKPAFTFQLLDEARPKSPKGLHVPTQFIAAQGDPTASSGSGADRWGIWRTDPGPGGVHLHNWKRIEAAQGVTPSGWRLDRQEWWVGERHGLMMEKPDFSLLPGKYRVTGTAGTTGLTILSDGRWELEGGAKLKDVTHLPCRSARYTARKPDASPGNAHVSAFPVIPGQPMPPVEGYDKDDYWVLFVTDVSSE
jgi:cell division protease FtsH